MIEKSLCHDSQEIEVVPLLLCCVGGHIECDILCVPTIGQEFAIIITLTIYKNPGDPAIDEAI